MDRNQLHNPFLDRLAERFATAGHRLYLVGGVVRDVLAEHPPGDMDLATDAPVETVKRLAAKARPQTIYAVGEKFGTVGATGIALRNGYLYFATTTSLERFKMNPGELKPAGPAEVVVGSFPTQRGHADKDFAFDDKGNRLPIDVKVGDVVIYSKYGGTEIKYNGEEYLVLSSRDVLAVVEN